MRFLYTLLFLFFLPLTLLGQTSPSQNQNYVRQINYQTALNQYEVEHLENTAINNDKKIENIVYYDGLGRPKQSVAIRAGGNREDLLTPIDYDTLGRQPKDWLPYPDLGNNGQFKTNVHTPLLGYYDSSFPKDRHNYTSNPYSENRFEDSPLNRVLERGAPGKYWKIDPNADTDHTIKFGYDFNSGSEVWNFSVAYPNGTDEPHLQLSTNSATYLANTLSRTVTKDENWQPSDQYVGITLEFQNKQGQTLLKRQTAMGANNQPYNVDTYYIYDDYGNLVYVLSPEGTAQIVSNNALILGHEGILDKLCYQYKYDYRNRLVEKKIPGKGWEHIVYDKLDRPVLTQDANMRSDNPNLPSQWLFTRYDELGRIAYTGIWTVVGGSREFCQNMLNTGTTFHVTRTTTPTTIGDTELYYSSNGNPISPLEVLTVNYYDDYVDYTVGGNNGLSLPTTVYGQKTTEDPTAETTANGLPTVSRVRVLGQMPQKWITSLTAYDSRGRAIYSDSYNAYLQSRDIVSSKLDTITGRILESWNAHSKNGQPSINVYDYYTYDHMGRLLSQKQRILGSPIQLIAENHYDALGKLVRKNVGGETALDGYTDMVKIDATADGTLYHTVGDWNWPSRAKTKGRIEAGVNGGITCKIPSSDKHVRVGLVKASNAALGNAYFDYGIYTEYDTGTQTNKVKLVLGNSSSTGNYGTYTAGTVFKVQRTGNLIRFYKNGSQFHSISAATGPLVGKVAFSGPDASVEGLALTGPNIDKKLQKIDYSYNIRGWLTDINDVDPGPSQFTIPLFSFRINYNTLEGNAAGTPLYNGNISQTLWKTMSPDKKIRGYAYGYDHLNRIVGANSYKGIKLSSMEINNEYTVDYISYDKNGNINTLARWGANNSSVPSFGKWDDLNYTYNGNQLINVLDTAGVPFGSEGFFSKIYNTGTQYNYDDNGNMIDDTNKGIKSIKYNHLNLPTEISFDYTKTNKIAYVYDATGMKLSKSVQEYKNNVLQLHKTEYANNYIYADYETSGTTKLQFFNTPEGYVIPVADTDGSVKGFDSGIGVPTFSSFSYVFQYKDHLGNVRLSYSDLDLNGAIDPNTEILDEKNYYPFGLEHKGYNTNISPSGNALAQQWKYNGVELNESLELNLYEMDFRQYDPAIGRFTSIDPITHFYQSTFTAFDNNPILFADPSGTSSETQGAQTDLWGRNRYGKNGVYIPPYARKASQDPLIDKVAIQSLKETAKLFFGNSEISNLSEKEKQRIFKRDELETIGVLLWEFATGTGKDEREFLVGKHPFAGAVLSGRVMNEIVEKFLKNLHENEYNFQEANDTNWKRFSVDFSPGKSPSSWIKSLSAHVNSNPSQFFIGGAVADVRVHKMNLEVLLTNHTSRNSLFLHMAKNYKREDGKRPLSTITQLIFLSYPVRSNKL